MLLIGLILFVLSFFPFIKQVYSHAEIQIIEMTKEGFEPPSLTTDADSTVMFLNKDTQPHWPASNVHPTHELYPEFDPRREIPPGESWTFKPTRAGEWKFHDHLFPHFRGSLTVIEGQNANLDISNSEGRKYLIDVVKDVFNNLVSKIKNIFAVFSLRPKQDIKLLNAQEFKKLSYDEQVGEFRKIAQSNPSRPWEYMKEVFRGEGGSSGNIHDLAHLAGILIYEKEGFDGISKCSTEFSFGCYHGFLDTAFAKDLSRLQDAESACKKLGAGISGPVASCIHGIGHGIASFYTTSDIKKSLTSCRKLSSGQDYCYDGVFMEFVRSAQDSFFKKDDPLYPCDALEREFGPVYSFSCGRNVPSLLMGRFKIGFSDVIKTCLSSDSKPIREACFDALGFAVAANGDVGQIISSCQTIGVSEHISRCIKAAAGELVFQEVPGWEEKSETVCNGFPELRSECVEHINRLVREYGKVRKINFTPRKEGENDNEYIRRQIRICYDGGGRDGCYKQVADLLYNTFGLSKTLRLLAENEINPEVYARCHEVTHYLSRNEFEQQQNIAKVYAKCDATCHGGCYHGTLEAYLKKQEDSGKSVTQEFPKICGDKETYQKPIEYNECLHGLGHAAMFVTDMELLESLKFCDTLSNPEHEERCQTGVFMENSSSSTSFDHKSKYIREGDPFYPCNILEEKYQSVCWQYQSSYFSILVSQDWKKVSDLCLKIPGQYQDRCFRTIGTNQVGFTTSLLTMKQDCDIVPSQFRDICVIGVVSSLSYRFVGDTQKMIDFCKITNQENRESCFKQMGFGFLDWDRNQEVAKRECQKIPDSKGQLWCMSVI